MRSSELRKLLKRCEIQPKRMSEVDKLKIQTKLIELGKWSVDHVSSN